MAGFSARDLYNVLQRLPQYDEVRIFLEAAEVLFPIRYHKRWARRIRESTGLTREDVSLVALASFGTDEPGVILGAHVLVTYDQALINGFRGSDSNWTKNNGKPPYSGDMK
jgi:hypothetical protein